MIWKLVYYAMIPIEAGLELTFFAWEALEGFVARRLHAADLRRRPSDVWDWSCAGCKRKFMRDEHDFCPDCSPELKHVK